MHLNRNDVNTALVQKRFIPFFHPLHDVDRGICMGAEMLARLPMPDGTVSLPGSFLPQMDTVRELPVLTRMLMAKAEKLLAEMTLPDGFIFTVNITPDMASETWLKEACYRLMACTKKRIMLVLELTEFSPLTRDKDEWQSQLRSLKDAGIFLALDDFGTGHSGLHLLLLSDARILKIPREFVCRLGECRVTASITDTVVDLADRLSIKLIAEGVETAAQQNILAAKGIQLMQGWHFSPPLSGSDFSIYMSQYH